MYTDEFNGILARGTRWLDVMLSNPEVNMRRFFPTEKLVRRTKAGVERMDELASRARGGVSIPTSVSRMVRAYPAFSA